MQTLLKYKEREREKVRAKVDTNEELERVVKSSEKDIDIIGRDSETE